jgi:hypothetical protein
LKPKPSTAFDVERIPTAMRAARRWVCWRPDQRDGKWTKVPVNARTLNLAKSNDPTTWSTFDDAVRATTADPGLGIGFMLGDGWLGVDLDGVVDPATGKITDPEVEAWLATTASYVETTPSKTGLHVIFEGVTIPAWSQNRRDFVEVYADKRFFTVTGDARFADREAIADQAAVDKLCDRWLRKDEPSTPSPVRAVADAATDHSADDFKLCVQLAERGRPRELIETVLRNKMRLEGRGSKADRPDYVPRTVEAAIRDAVPRSETPKPLRLRKWTRFPVEALPRTIRDWSEEHARAKGVDPSLVALPLLVGCAGFIGNTVAVGVRGDWVEPIALWIAIVAPSGSKKSPAMRAAMKPFRQRQSEHYARAKSENAGKPDGERSHAARRFVDDATPEAVFGLLESNPRGLLAQRDELAEMLAGFGRFKSGKQAGLGEASQACKLYDASPHDVDRRSTGHAHIPKPLVSIVGAIPPKTFRTLFVDAFKANGLFARFVPVFPPSTPARFVEEEPDWRVDMAVDKLAAWLDAISLPEDENTGEPKPNVLSLSENAKRLWREFHDELAVEAHRIGDGLAASATSKTAGLALRVAGLFHVVETWESNSELLTSFAVPGDRMERAISLVRWLHAERLRVFAILEAEAEDVDLCELAESIAWEKYPDGVTAREVFEGRKGTFDNADHAETRLRAASDRGLLEARWGVRGDPSRGGRETWIFARRATLQSETPENADLSGGFEVSSSGTGAHNGEAD